MAHDSRILIAELMFGSDAIDPARDLGTATFDITMFNMGGKERSEAGFRRLLDSVGCELVRVWRNEAGPGVIVEARLKGTAAKVVDGPALDEPHPDGSNGASVEPEHAPESTNEAALAVHETGAVESAEASEAVTTADGAGHANGVPNGHEHGHADAPEQTTARPTNGANGTAAEPGS